MCNGNRIYSDTKTHKYDQLQNKASTTVKDLPITTHDEPTKPFHDPDHAKLDETSVSDINSDNGDDDYDTTDVLESFNSSEVKCVHPILSLTEQNADILTWNKKTGEIVFHNQNVRDSNIIELLKDMFTAN